LNGPSHGILDGRGRGAGQLDEFIDVIFHMGIYFGWMPPT
jgi:hypothetical protein